MSGRPRPIVYGTPGLIAVLMDSLAAVLRQEPEEVFRDLDVREAGMGLADSIVDRLAITRGDDAAPSQDRFAS